MRVRSQNISMYDMYVSWDASMSDDVFGALLCAYRSLSCRHYWSTVYNYISHCRDIYKSGLECDPVATGISYSVVFARLRISVCVRN